MRRLQEAGVQDTLASAILDENRASRVTGLRTALGVLALLAALGLFFTGGVPARRRSAGGADA